MPLCFSKYDGFDFSRDHTIEVSRDFLVGVVGLVNVETKRFYLTHDHLIDVSRDFVGEVLSS